MIMQPVKYLKEMLSIDEGTAVDTVVDTVIDTALSTAPVIGNLLQSSKIIRLEKRLKLNEEQLLKVKDKIESSQNEILYKREIFPFIIGTLMDDDEDAKSKVMIDGFEHIIDNNILEAERIYHYYDVLSELRYSDIMLFVEEYMPADMKKDPLNIKFNLHKLRDEYKELRVIEKYQINKFLRLGLIEDKANNRPRSGMTFATINPHESTVQISDFGRQFLEFFSIDDSEE